MNFKDLLVVIPHSGILIPHEIPIASVSGAYTMFMRNVDWYTNWLYDFRDMLRNSRVVYPYCNLNPADIGQSVPLKDVFNAPVYRTGLEPDEKLRTTLSKRYLRPFHHEIKNRINAGVVFMLDAHSTLSGKGMTDNQIELMNYQVQGERNEKVYFCPDIIIDTYAKSLIRCLPGIKITVNQSRYGAVYGHICAEYSVNAMKKVGNRVPALLQETNKMLYMNADRTPDYKTLETLRRAFPESLCQVRKKIVASC